MYHKIIQFIEYMDIYVDAGLVYAEVMTTGAQIREVVMKHSRGKKNRCPACGVDLGEPASTDRHPHQCDGKLGCGMS